MTENLMTVQFDHRMLAITTATLAIVFASFAWATQHTDQNGSVGAVVGRYFSGDTGHIDSFIRGLASVGLRTSNGCGCLFEQPHLGPPWFSFAQEDSLETESQLVSK